MVHVLRYLQQKAEDQNVIAKLTYKHLFNCAIFGTIFNGKIWRKFYLFSRTKLLITPPSYDRFLKTKCL